MDFFYLQSPQIEPVFGLRFLADFLKEALAAVVGAGIGAWLGARFAFKSERMRFQADRTLAEQAAANERQLAAEAAAEKRKEAAEQLAATRATAGNLAIFGLSQIYNDLLAFKRQFLDPAKRTPAPWFWLPPVSVAERNYYHFDVVSLAFLFQSKTPGAPIMPTRIAIEQDRFATWLETLQLRSKFHQQYLPPIIEKLQKEHGLSYQPTEQELREAIGERIYQELRNYFSDVERLGDLGVSSSKSLGDDLRAVLVSDLPGQIIIGFERADEMLGGSPLMQARNEAAQREPPPPPR